MACNYLSIPKFKWCSHCLSNAKHYINSKWISANQSFKKNCREIVIKIFITSEKKTHLNMWCPKFSTFCLHIHVLISWHDTSTCCIDSHFPLHLSQPFIMYEYHFCHLRPTARSVDMIPCWRAPLNMETMDDKIVQTPHEIYLSIAIILGSFTKFISQLTITSFKYLPEMCSVNISTR